MLKRSLTFLFSLCLICTLLSCASDDDDEDEGGSIYTCEEYDVALATDKVILQNFNATQIALITGTNKVTRRLQFLEDKTFIYKSDYKLTYNGNEAIVSAVWSGDYNVDFGYTRKAGTFKVLATKTTFSLTSNEGERQSSATFQEEITFTLTKETTQINISDYLDGGDHTLSMKIEAEAEEEDE